MTNRSTGRQIILLANKLIEHIFFASDSDTGPHWNQFLSAEYFTATRRYGLVL